MSNLSAEDVRALLEYDKVTGELRWRVRVNSRVDAGDLAGTTDSKGYGQIKIKGRFYRTHRVIWLIVTGSWPALKIDHRNGKRLDNSWKNLREATQKQNNRNRRRRPNTPSGAKGVTWDATRSKWKAQITVDGIVKYLGRFETVDAAQLAYQAAAISHHGEFANLLG